ncbi:MAG: phosphatidylserine decarboxylase family protein [bacterium]
MFTKYGYNTIGVVAIIDFLLIILSFFIQSNFIKIPLILIAVALLAFTLYFFRDPERTPPSHKGIIVAPADGVIIIVKEIEQHKYIQDGGTQISIFMSPLNVHVNRIPISGMVDYYKYIEGEYLVAFHDKADERNERTEIGILSEYGKMFYTQVAGMVARRIVCNLKAGDSVKVGERFGMIKFGSRSDVVVPKGWKLKVKKGDKVTAGETILFEFDK